MRGIDDSRRRGAFCTALECTCGAISTYLRSWERSTYPQITRQRFSAHLLPTYRYLLSAWLPSEDTEVKLAVLKASAEHPVAQEGSANPDLWGHPPAPGSVREEHRGLLHHQGSGTDLAGLFLQEPDPRGVCGGHLPHAE